MSEALRVLLVDPSLFTAPYDAALTEGLLEVGVEPLWAVRPTREADRQELPEARSLPLFYGWIERQAWLPPRLRSAAKGLAHVVGLGRLVSRAVAERPDAVHFQWVVVPPLDSLAMALLRLYRPLVLTVHDTVPYNGDRLSPLQRWGFELPLRLADRIIVHTRSGRDALLARGVPAEKLAVIPHGALPLHAAPPAVSTYPDDGRYRFVLFGELKPYKGLDVLLEALALVDPELREQLHVVVAGRPRMDLRPLLERRRELGLERVVDVRPQRLSEAEMADLFQAADCFLFPYRQIDASGVYYLVKSLGKWLIASRVGIFAEDLGEQHGELVPVADPSALAAAISEAVKARRHAPAAGAGSDWSEIGRLTRALYEDARAARAGAFSGARLGASG